MASTQRPITSKGLVTPAGQQVPPKKKVATACKECRKGRRRCDELRPSCSNCVRLHKVCEFDGVDMRKKEVWKATISAMEQKIMQLEEHIRQLSSEPTSQAAVDTGPIQSKRLAKDSASSTQAIGSISSSEDLIGMASSHNISDSTAQTSIELFDTGFGKIPIEAFTQLAISAFLSGTACLFYILPAEECRDLAYRVYHRHNNIGRSDICELCTIAAVGCRYDGASTDKACMAAYVQNAMFLLCDVLEEVNMKTIQILTCLSMYLILDKSISARLMISGALHLTRWYRLSSNHGQDAQAEWFRVFRTLTSLESWLSFALGYQHGLSEDEIYSVEYFNNMEMSNVASEDPQPATMSMIQTQLSKITLLAAKVFSQAEFDAGTPASWERFEQCSNYLDVWRQEIPDSLELQGLVSNNNGLPDDYRRALLLVHMVYLEDRVLLYQHFMRQSSDIDILNMSPSFHRTYATFAHQLAWIIDIMFRDRGPFLRSWLVIHALFHAAITLLSSTCQYLLNGSDPGCIEAYLTDVNMCIEVLSYCGLKDAAATDFNDILRPLYRRLQVLASNTTRTVTQRTDMMNIQSLLNHPSSNKSHIFDLLRELVNTVAFNNHPAHG